MFEKILDVLKTFFEKYFIQALVAILPTIIIYYFTPDDFDFLKKVGKELFILFSFILCFLIIELTIYIFNTIKKKYYYNKLKKEQENKEEQKTLHYLWNYVDSLDHNQKKLVQYIIDNDNVILSINGCLFFNRLFEDWFNQTQITSDGSIKGFDIFKIKETELIAPGNIVTQYKMKDEIFEALKYSKNKYGKISNFQ